MVTEAPLFVNLLMENPKAQLIGLGISGSIATAAGYATIILESDIRQCIQKASGQPETPNPQLPGIVKREIEILPNSIPTSMRQQYQDFWQIVQQRHENYQQISTDCKQKIDPHNLDGAGTLITTGTGAVAATFTFVLLLRFMVTKMTAVRR